MKDRSRNVVVGITAVLGLAGFAALLTMFGYVPKLLEESYQVVVELPEAGGLTKDNAVRLSGIQIGRVVDVSFNPPPRQGVRVTLKIDGDRAIPRDARVTVYQPLLTGSPALMFDVQALTPEQMIQTLATDGSAKVVADASALAPAFQRPLDAMRMEFKRPIDQFARMEDRFNQLADAWTRVGNNIESMTAARTTQQVDSGEAAVNLTSFLSRADQRVTEMKKLLESVRTTMEQMKKSAAKIDTAATAVTGTVENAGRNFEQLMKRYVATADDLSALITDTRKLVQKASDGQGSLGKLINDASLYENLDNSAARIGKAMDEIRLMIEKWNAEGVPIQF